MKHTFSADLAATIGAALFRSLQTARPAGHRDSSTASNDNTRN